MTFRLLLMTVVLGAPLILGGCLDSESRRPAGETAEGEGEEGEGEEGEGEEGEGEEGEGEEGEGEEDEGAEGEGEEGEGEEGEGEGEADPLAACADALVAGVAWFEAEADAPLTGVLELGQTHMVRADDTRIVARLSAERETLALFTPERPLEGADVRVAAWDGERLLGVLQASPPERMPPLLEQALTATPLDPYSERAWSATLPWSWVREGATLRIGALDEAGLRVHEHVLEDLGAPHRFTVSRSKLVMFGEAGFDTRTMPATQLAQDFFPSLPGAELRLVDSTPLRVDTFVVNTEDGPRVVRSEEERLSMTSDPNRWNILKHQFALRLNTANTGRGLVRTVPGGGDSSPYSFGTSLGLGWVRTADGVYHDVNDAGLAAGWTGWTALWAGECGNGFIHELGHSMTLLHFTEGTGASWGIGDEYPRDGTNLETHPWGYDTVRRQIRTWYRVNAQGPAGEAGQWQGKRDPMNGGEPSNGVTCFPQYTNFHARKIQRWMQDTPTILEVDGEPGLYLWDPDAHAYAPTPVDPPSEVPVAVDVPVVILIGTLGREPEAAQTYPPLYSVSGNLFSRPDPAADDLPGVFAGARWYLEVEYADGVTERSLIAHGAIEDASLGVYSLNLDAGRDPLSVALYQSPAGYPDIDFDSAQLMHTRPIEGPSEPTPQVVTVGRGKLANGPLTLTELCTPGVSCAGRVAESSWRVHAAPLRFADDAGQTPEPTVCSARGGHTVLRVPAVGPDGERVEIEVHAQRVVASRAGSVRVPINDVTPWNTSPDVTQSLRVWIPYAANADLAPGRHRSAGELVVHGLRADEPFSATALHIDLTVLEHTPADLGEEVVSPPLTTPASSMYFLLRDGRIGPTARIWWGGAGPTPLRLPVYDEAGGAEAILVLDAWQQETCGGRSSRWELHAGRVAGECEHRAVLRVAAVGNEHLQRGRTYRTDPSSPLVIEGRRWHAPEAEKLIRTFAFDVAYTARGL